MLKKFMATMLAASLLIVAAACGGTQGTTGSTGTTTANGTTTEGDGTTDGEGTTTEGEETTGGFTDVKTYTFLHAWNGGAAAFPFGFEDGAISKAIEEKTGVLKIIFITA